MDSHALPRRALRRYHIARLGQRRRAEHLFFAHPPRGPFPSAPDCVCEQSLFFFAKRGVLPCGCSKKSRGRPKLGNGICYYGELRPTVVSRRRARALCRDVMSGQADPWNV